MENKRYRSLLYFSVALSLLVGWVLAACTAAAERERNPVALSAVASPDDEGEVAAAPAAVAPAPRGNGGGLYDFEPEPLTLADCARCHIRHFEQIRDDGGGHRIDCRQCHEVFHAYNPRRNNYDELMPKCTDCHGLPHGEAHVSCFGCHEQAHAPTRIPFSDLLVSSCADCHGTPAAQLRQYASKHSGLGCQACHPRDHGRILSCMECHGPHFPQQPLAECAQCHGAHKPLDMTFPVAGSAVTCNACHGEIYGQWKNTPSRHGGVDCAQCHARHLAIPSCTECHPQPHSEGMLANFTGCLDCHIDVHDLPVR